jgi:arylsulfatase A-like enzyme
MTSFSPTIGPTGISVTIFGKYFATTTNVRFNGVEASFQVASRFKLIATVPELATTGPITVSRSIGGTTSEQNFVVQPNIVLILTDDQRYDEMSMPTVQSELVSKGTTFTRGFVEDPLCCPSRTTILTGKASHGTDIYDNRSPHGGFETFTSKGEDQSTIATWLQNSGYYTGLIGKYLNGYFPESAGYVPPGWDVWDAVTIERRSEGLYKNYYMSINGRSVFYGKRDTCLVPDPCPLGTTDYSTDVLRAYARQFLSSAPADKPLFMMFTPVAPHLLSPPPRRYKDSFQDLPPLRPPSDNEADVSDKPTYVRDQPLLTTDEQSRRDALRVRQFQSLLGVDDAVKNIIDALSSSGRLGSTLIVFASDNGLLFGEHRWTEKKVPYEESIRVPIVVRYDPITQETSRRDDHFVLNMDFAPTFAAGAGVNAPGAEGVSILPLLRGNATGWRLDFLVEHANADKVTVPPYCAVRAKGWVYVEYATGETELYDLANDPYELQNLSGMAAHSEQESAMHDRMLQLCSPPPPGFTP